MTRAVVITGTSTGIGRSCALTLDRQGFAVFAGVRTPEDAEALTAAASARLHPVIVDITDPATIESAQRTVMEANVPLAGLVNNAGSTLPCPLEYLPLNGFRQQLEINLIGHLAVTQAFLPLLREARGRIVMMSSLGGLLPIPTMGCYTAAKHALEGMSGVLRLELAPWGIHVAVVEPGHIATPMGGKLRRDTTTAVGLLPEEGALRYGAVLRAVESAVAGGAEDGAPPDVVARAVVHALTARRPRARYPVGPMAGRMTVLSRLLPDRWIDRILRRTFNLPSVSDQPTPIHTPTGGNR